uniref:ShKT domain-containing protein n=1 Tax=Trichuris muris TaxID=70415 RepID=A0A5S6QIN4_TRIMR
MCHSITAYVKNNILASVIPPGFKFWINGVQVTDPAQLEKILQRYPQFMLPSLGGFQKPQASITTSSPVVQRPQQPIPFQTPQQSTSQSRPTNTQDKSQTASGAINLSADVRKFAVDEHNMYRRKIANGEVPNMPAATMMIELMWSDAIAAKASEWASKCEMAHTPQGYYCGLDGYDNIGENLATRTTSADGLNSDEKLKDAFQRAFKNWFEEYKNYNFATRGCSKVCGHFTQMVKDSSEKLGCGIAMCPTGVKGFQLGTPSYLIVCNYGPGNNFSNKPAYETGVSKKCPQIRPVLENGLCTGNGKRGPEKCVDKTGYCSVWKTEGKCEMCNNAYYQWMIGECPKTCGVC